MLTRRRRQAQISPGLAARATHASCIMHHAFRAAGRSSDAVHCRGDARGFRRVLPCGRCPSPARATGWRRHDSEGGQESTAGVFASPEHGWGWSRIARTGDSRCAGAYCPLTGPWRTPAHRHCLVRAAGRPSTHTASRTCCRAPGARLATCTLRRASDGAAPRLGGGGAGAQRAVPGCVAVAVHSPAGAPASASRPEYPHRRRPCHHLPTTAAAAAAAAVAPASIAVATAAAAGRAPSSPLPKVGKFYTPVPTSPPLLPAAGHLPPDTVCCAAPKKRRAAAARRLRPVGRLVLAGASAGHHLI